jgi:hypothetical protein
MHFSSLNIKGVLETGPSCIRIAIVLNLVGFLILKVPFFEPLCVAPLERVPLHAALAIDPTVDGGIEREREGERESSP